MQTGYFTDERFADHTNWPGHPENQQRLEAIERAIAGAGLAELRRPTHGREATEQELELCHTPAHVTRLRELAANGGGDITRDTRVVPASFRVASLACGAALAAVDAVAAGDLDNAFAIVRPPGHHATTDCAMGFCLFNNVAIAARYLQRRHGVGRVAILDWDVHHGNGTQQTFYADNSVFFASVHQSPLFPYSGESHEKGSGPAIGTTLNFPVAPGRGDREYLDLWEEVCREAESFRPDFTLVSAGFDAHFRDPLGGMQVTEAGFAQMTALTKTLATRVCQNRLVCVLEGGYDLQGLAESVVAVLQELQR